jgi:hypothetical protein
LLDPTRSFVNVAGNDYHLSSTSPLIGVGTAQQAPATDLEGSPRPSGNGFDIGAYEYQTAANTTTPKVTSTSPAANATGMASSTAVTATFNEPVQPATIGFVLTDAANNVVPTTLSYDAGSSTATLTPSAALAASTTYTATVGGAKDMAGDAMAGATTWSFTTDSAPTPPTPPTSPTPPTTTSSTIWDASTTPTVSSDPDTNAVELGVKFSSSADGSITGIRFYLWSSTGQLLATATFTGETTSGWQQVNFASPVAIKANTTYVASYLAPAGHYADDHGYFASGYDSGTLHVPANGGVFKYGAGGGFPTQAWSASNYWVDVAFTAGTTSNTAASPTLAGTTNSIMPPSPNVARTTVASSTSSSAIPTSNTSPTPAGVDQVFTGDDSTNLPIILGSHRKNKQA